MITTDMRIYDYFLYGEEDEYGQAQESTEAQGTIKMSINITSQSIQDNINYKDSKYIGLTQDPKINDKYIIQYGEERLKVLYINNKGRYKQVFLGAM